MEEEGTEPEFEWAESVHEAKGRNAGDIDLALQAAELLHTEAINCFCIASGDSDFSGVANRLRKAGNKIVGIGKRTKTAESFRGSCDAFEDIGAEEGHPSAPNKTSTAKKSGAKAAKTARGAGETVRSGFVKLVCSAVKGTTRRAKK